MAASAFPTLYNALNPEQKRAVDTIDGPVMVIAGPGTGKTQILTLRIAAILRKTDTPPDAILALTFTESAAFGMRKRLVDIIGAAAYRVRIHTFHGFANDIIGRYLDAFPRIIGSRAMTDVERIELLQKLIVETPLEHLRPWGEPLFYAPSISQKIGELKREHISPDRFEKLILEREKAFRSIPDLYYISGVHAGSMRGKYAQDEKRLARDKELLLLYRGYEALLAKRRLYDFEDMILEVVRTLESRPDLLLAVQEECQYILADEHQDANASQNRLLELVSSFHAHPNLFVVGDEKQAIFRFQGASLSNFLYFKKHYPDAAIITLRENYRSTQAILDSAHELMRSSAAHPDIPRVPLLARLGGAGEKIRIVTLPRPGHERSFVAAEAKRLIAEGVAPQDIAVLYRVNGDADLLGKAFAASGVPFVIESSQNALDDRSVGKFLAILRAVAWYGREEMLSPLLHVDLLGLPPLAVARFLAKGNVVKYRSDMLWEALGDKNRLLGYGITKPQPFVALSERLERWKTLAENEDLLTALERIAEESGLVATLIQADNPEEKLGRLAALFTEARTYMTAAPHPDLAGFLRHLELLETYRISLSAPPAIGDRNAVRLMTAHRAKGLEFEHVYVVHANDGHWGGRTSRHYFSPIDLEPNQELKEGSDADERRLFYVALTRAKVSLTITCAHETESGRPALPSTFIEEIGPDMICREDRPAASELLVPERTPAARHLDRALVRAIFAEQGLSVTAINNYLACPWRFFYRNLLRVPEAPEKGLAYGTAVHTALREFFELWKDGEDPGAEGLVDRFVRALATAPMSEGDRTESVRKGGRALRMYYKQYHTTWSRSILNEYKMTVFLPTSINDLPRIRLRGDLDKLEFGEQAISVIDYKTGRPKSRREIEVGDYKRQLIFYKLLLRLFEGGRWHMQEGIIDFIEPDERGRMKREAFSITEEEVDEIAVLTERVAREIWTLAFVRRTCGESDCRYCKMRELTQSSLSLKQRGDSGVRRRSRRA